MALAAARRAPERLSGLVLLTATPPPCTCAAQDFSIILRKPAGGSILVDALNGAIRAYSLRQ